MDKINEIINKIPIDEMEKLKNFCKGNSFEALRISQTITKIKKETNLNTDQISSIVAYLRKSE